MAVKVLVVDDSMTMRALFTNALETSRELVVVGAADGAAEAREMIGKLYPDVVTLDVEMPGMSGIDFLRELMETRPIPVVMLSSLTQKGADISLKAIEIGAVDCFPKPAKATPDEFSKIAGKLCKTVLTAAKTNLAARRAAKAQRPAGPAGYEEDGRIIAITGGMGAMEAASEMLSAFPANCPPTLVVLQMDEGLAIPFAARLTQSIAPKVKVAGDNQKLESGTVYVAADPERHVVVDRWPNGNIRLIARDPVNGCRPSADLLFAALAKTGGAQVRGVLLSGGGNDGAAGIAALGAAGGHVYGQSPETALVSEAVNAAQQRCTLTLAAPGELATRVLEGNMAHAA